MLTKRFGARTIKVLDNRESFEVKKVGGDTYISGWANKAVVDRGKDLIQMDAWNIDNYKKVPTILFNHDKDKPIGKAVDVRPTEQGLWIKAKISNSKDPEISKIRDLVNEGMLNAFSVGFDSQDEQKDADGINNIKQAELYEVSVVTLPMNQDSVFDVSTKSLMSMTIEDARSTILKAKGAWLAEAVHGKIYELEKSGETRAQLLAKIASAAQIGDGDMLKVLAGDVTPVPENVLGAFSEVLGLDLEELKTLDAGDAELKKKAEEMPPEKDPAACKDIEGGKLQPQVISLKIPKADAADEQMLQTMLADAGYEGATVSEDGDNWVVQVADPAGFGEPVEMDMGDGTIAMVAFPKAAPEEAAEPQTEMAAPPPKTPEPPPAEGNKKPPVPPHPSEAPKPADAPKPPAEADPHKPAPKPPAAEPKPAADAPPQAAPNPGDAPPAADAPPPADDAPKADVEQFKKDEAAAMNGQPPSWVGDEQKWAAAVKATQDSLGKMDYAFAMTWYFENGGERKQESSTVEKSLAPIPGGGDANPIDDNPYLAQARQTNVLLGVLIKTMQEMCASMQGGAIQPLPAAPQSTPPAPPKDAEAEMEKMFVKNAEEFIQEIEQKLLKNGA